MPVPSPRNSIRIARGNYADLNSNVNEIGDGELCFALDQDKFYSKSGGVLVEVGKGTALATLGQIADIDVAGASDGQLLQYNSTSGNWEAGSPTGAPVDSVAGRTGDVTLTSSDVGLGNVDNTSDADKPVSTATQTALDAKADLTALDSKADVTALDSKADVTDLDSKADVADLDSKADVTDLDSKADVTALDAKADLTDLDSKADLVGGLVPTSQIPAIAITEFLGSVAGETAMLALTGQPGDWCLRTDKAVGYVIVGADPSLIENWAAFTVPGSAVTSINTQVGDVVLGAADVGAATAAQGTTADTALQPNTSITVTGIDISGVQTSNIASATYSIDCSLGNYFTASINSSGTFSFINVPSGTSYGLTIEVTHNAGAISWPGAVTWPKDTAPTLTTGKTHVFVFITDDGGSRWRGAALVDYTN